MNVGMEMLLCIAKAIIMYRDLKNSGVQRPAGCTLQYIYANGIQCSSLYTLTALAINRSISGPKLIDIAASSTGLKYVPTVLTCILEAACIVCGNNLGQRFRYLKLTVIHTVRYYLYSLEPIKSPDAAYTAVYVSLRGSPSACDVAERADVVAPNSIPINILIIGTSITGVACFARALFRFAWELFIGRLSRNETERAVGLARTRAAAVPSGDGMAIHCVMSLDWKNFPNSLYDKLEFPDMFIPVYIVVGSQCTRYAQVNSEPTTDLRVNKRRITVACPRMKSRNFRASDPVACSEVLQAPHSPCTQQEPVTNVQPRETDHPQARSKGPITRVLWRHLPSYVLVVEVGYSTRLPPRRAGFYSQRVCSWNLLARGNRAGRCHWSAGFLGDILFPPSLHSSSAQCPPRFLGDIMFPPLLHSGSAQYPPCFLGDIMFPPPLHSGSAQYPPRFLGDIMFPPLLHSGSAQCPPRFTLIGSQEPGCFIITLITKLCDQQKGGMNRNLEREHLKLVPRQSDALRCSGRILRAVDCGCVRNRIECNASDLGGIPMSAFTPGPADSPPQLVASGYNRNSRRSRNTLAADPLRQIADWLQLIATHCIVALWNQLHLSNHSDQYLERCARNGSNCSPQNHNQLATTHTHRKTLLQETVTQNLIHHLQNISNSFTNTIQEHASPLIRSLATHMTRIRINPLSTGHLRENYHHGLLHPSSSSNEDEEERQDEGVSERATGLFFTGSLRSPSPTY
ncbi:hypothetical protein PR048_018909 [Dryococelus australis]|uniref:Uncharacterized protein n=1 Tax=Dryococelus australis TaxID=614101 RepID=A0ABQ9H256_9NEOP|nr:hypothetical protein PR048_018909 [Dryococelus australis]